MMNAVKKLKNALMKLKWFGKKEQAESKSGDEIQGHSYDSVYVDDIPNMQALHQWRFMNDESYRMSYRLFLFDLGTTIDELEELKLMIIPTEDNDDCTIN